SEESALKHEVGLGIDQMHMVDIGVEQHRRPWCPGVVGADAAAHFRTAETEVHHSFHAHGLNHIERRTEFATLARLAAVVATGLDNSFWPQSEKQVLADRPSITGSTRLRYRKGDCVGDTTPHADAVLF